MKRVLFILLLVFCQSVQASPKECVRHFRLGVNNYSPLYEVQPDGTVSGLTYDLLSEISARMGCVFSQIPMDSPRMLEDFKRWRLDMVAFMAPLEELKSAGEYISLYQAARKLIVAKSFYDKSRKAQDYLNDPKVKFGSQIGPRFFLGSEEEKRLMGQGRLISFPNPGAAYKQFVTGRIQAMFSTPIIHWHFQKEMPDLVTKTVAVPDVTHPLTMGFYISLRRISKAEADKIKKVVQEMKQDGTLRKIVSRYVDGEDMIYYQNL
ncbi:transporter substrate-binding domain-containing protein [Bdellovibrio bacteriovorus]|uniref:substrate-binding periplasmic protein n=1 Tax=Bdellovibrio bacteriovorus TaxID=959 RepID=UPI0021D31350|nr:transporter substrate-binding domain-containing protein [Bdellovibrio bacteriovorus]UXR64945.1 transporter substrate-binding domain-containing protein [Bdellovibrio bacteriovorus]